MDRATEIELQLAKEELNRHLSPEAAPTLRAIHWSGRILADDITPAYRERALRAILTLAVAFGSACGPQWTATDHLTVTGEPPPVYAAEVLAAAQARCNRPIVGELEWRAHGELAPRHITGRCHWDEAAAPMEAWVAVPNPQDGVRGVAVIGPESCWPGSNLWGTAFCTAEAHEIGHWCLLSEDEDEVEAWAQLVLADAAVNVGLVGMP